MDVEALARAAILLVDARLATQPLPDLTGSTKPGSAADGYAIQAALAESKTYSRETIGEIIKAALPAIEIVENRYGDFLMRGAPTLIADVFFPQSLCTGSSSLQLARHRPRRG